MILMLQESGTQRAAHVVGEEMEKMEVVAALGVEVRMQRNFKEP